MRNPNSFNHFRELVAKNTLEPAASNLYEVRIAPPSAFLENFSVSYLREIGDALNYFASSVTTPSRAVTTGEVNQFGMMRRFATGQTNSQINMSFLVTKNQIHRDFFEKWVNLTASDMDNTVGFYDDYVTEMQIVKWEKGSNVVVSMAREIPGRGEVRTKATVNQATGVWKLYGIYPTNISTMTFDQEQTNLLQLDITFNFERYRFDTINEHTLKYLGPDWDKRNQARSEAEVDELAQFGQNPDAAGYGL
ncbi:hypothetical protein SSZBM1_70 [Synechococcus phage S-SZBM1]|uniref:Uncharacterized protein n=1 Tax=Synechococcus phage S-SZBM1 TaxID=2926475 RepID=A0AC61TSG9_9CAUD|nr:tail tube [Synechococcus phage S-SZBM1]UNH61187.1 hypothetical protein SSZBM1_70 [Synechococcus phage S-SZBM1]